MKDFMRVNLEEAKEKQYDFMWLIVRQFLCSLNIKWFVRISDKETAAAVLSLNQEISTADQIVSSQTYIILLLFSLILYK